MMRQTNNIKRSTPTWALERLRATAFSLCCVFAVAGAIGVHTAHAKGLAGDAYPAAAATAVALFGKEENSDEPTLVSTDDDFRLVFAPPPVLLKGSTAQTGSSTVSSGSASVLLRRSAPAGILAAGSATSSLALSSSTPYLPFLGNPFVLVSVPNATVLANVTVAYAVDLRRQANCSINEDLVLPGSAGTATPNSALIASIPGAQDYFHQLSGLTTTPDVFAKGCDYPIFGQPSSGNILLLGITATGAVLSAEPANAGIYITITDPTANTFKSTPTILSTTLGASRPPMSTAMAIWTLWSPSSPIQPRNRWPLQYFSATATALSNPARTTTYKATSRSMM